MERCLRWRGSYGRGGADGSLNLWETALFFINLCRMGDVLEYLLVPSTQAVRMVMELCEVDGEETCSPGRF